MSRGLGLCCWVLCGALLAGCAAGSAPPGASPIRAAGAMLDDATIKIGVESRLAGFGAPVFANVAPKVFSGEVLLIGRVPDETSRVLAARAAMDTPGVRGVYNALTVGPAPGVFERVDDARISGLIRASLIANSTIAHQNYMIETVDGVVHIVGAARSAAELRLVADIAAGTLGVRGVALHARVMG